MSLNNITTESKIFGLFAAWIETADDGMNNGREDEAVDTREPIENFFIGRDVNIISDETTDGVRSVIAFTKNPNKQIKNSLKKLFLMNDGTTTLVLVE